ncbi:MAG TPA: hypothetical protein VFS12_08620 [Terriglobia bacterium]|nr:hypothetical protein [Terriglobia bacterium]
MGVEIPFFNRNQGNVAAARANLGRAKFSECGFLFACEWHGYKEYQDALITAERYRAQMIPRAQQAYDLYVNNFRRMAAAYPQVLIAQRNLFQLQQDSTPS